MGLLDWPSHLSACRLPGDPASGEEEEEEEEEGELEEAWVSSSGKLLFLN